MFQVPALLREGLTVVVSPLIALMEDQVATLDELGVPAVALNSTLNPEQQRDIAERLQRGEIKLLYLAPERLVQPRMLAFLQRLPVGLFAIDEAHCVSQWGHDFRPGIPAARPACRAVVPEVPRIALTATADMRTREEMIQRLHLQNAEQFLSSFDRPNIFYRIVPRSSRAKQLLGFLSERRGDAGIVYCLSRKKVEEVAEFLGNQGFPALPYHAGLSTNCVPTTRSASSTRKAIMVATIAFGMGIDKPNVRFVAHLDLPRPPGLLPKPAAPAAMACRPTPGWPTACRTSCCCGR